MLIVRETFTAKPGMGSKLAKFFKDNMKDMPGPKPARVMTDFVGDYNTVVMEFEHKDIADFERSMKEYAKMPAEMRQKMSAYTEMWMTGKREIFQTVD